MRENDYSDELSGSANPAAQPRLKTTRLESHAKRPGRDDTLDEDLESERLKPGLDSEGTGGAGADPEGPHDGGNSNT